MSAVLKQPVDTGARSTSPPSSVDENAVGGAVEQALGRRSN